MSLTVSTEKKVYLLWLSPSSTKAKLDNPGWLDSQLILGKRETDAPRGNCACRRRCARFQEGHFKRGKPTTGTGCAFSSKGSVSPEPWPFSKVDSIFPHVGLYCILTKGVKTWLDFCSNMSRQCSIRSECRPYIKSLGSYFMIRSQTCERLRMFDLHKWLFKIDHYRRDWIYHIKHRQCCVLYKVVSNTVVNGRPVDLNWCVVRIMKSQLWISQKVLKTALNSRLEVCIVAIWRVWQCTRRFVMAGNVDIGSFTSCSWTEQQARVCVRQTERTCLVQTQRSTAYFFALLRDYFGAIFIRQCGRWPWEIA